MSNPPADLVEELKRHEHDHLLQWWSELTSGERDELTRQIESVDFEALQSVWRKSQAAATLSAAGIVRADVAAAPRSVVRQPQTEEQRASWQAAKFVGRQLLADSKVAVITVAGGQGSRLGFDYPKGMFPIGPVSDRTLFQIFAEQILARKQRHGGEIPWLVMTSSATHDATVEFFSEKKHFGIDPAAIHFFQQGSMPAVDAATGKVLMSDKASLCLSPDGHGGLVTALESSGLLAMLNAAGVEHVFYHQVDNPTAIICDPALLGLHDQHQSQLTTKVVEKLSPTERMGALVDLQGQTEIIEYSELTPEQASRTDESGQWVFWAGNTAIHVFARKFFEELTTDGCHLELHLASKKVPHLNTAGVPIEPSKPNAHKFERFIFDALPLASNALIVEGHRQREFNPVKNAEGNDSPETAKAALNRIAQEWLQQAGHSIPESTPVELSPLLALDADELADKLAQGEVTLPMLLKNL